MGAGATLRGQLGSRVPCLEGPPSRERVPDRLMQAARRLTYVSAPGAQVAHVFVHRQGLRGVRLCGRDKRGCGWSGRRPARIVPEGRDLQKGSRGQGVTALPRSPSGHRASGQLTVPPTPATAGQLCGGELTVRMGGGGARRARLGAEAWQPSLSLRLRQAHPSAPPPGQ